MRWILGLLLLLTIGCGHSPTSPTPVPTPTPAPVPVPAPTPAPSFTGSVTDTVSGAPIVGFTAVVSGSRVTVSAPGYLTRDTANDDAVDLIHDVAPFDLGFYRQLTRGALNGLNHNLLTLSASPSVYIQTAGMSAALVSGLDDAARATVPAMTGGRLHVVTIEHGETARPEQSGWIVVELAHDDGQQCGRTSLGAEAGHIWLNTVDRCRRNGEPIGSPNLLAHEIGHALGFEHVSPSTALMNATVTTGTPSDAERYHAAIAYSRPRLNRDVDIDP